MNETHKYKEVTEGIKNLAEGEFSTIYFNNSLRSNLMTEADYR